MDFDSEQNELDFFSRDSEEIHHREFAEELAEWNKL